MHDTAASVSCVSLPLPMTTHHRNWLQPEARWSAKRGGGGGGGVWACVHACEVRNRSDQVSSFIIKEKKKEKGAPTRLLSRWIVCSFQTTTLKRKKKKNHL